MIMTLESLPVELIAEILSSLDLESLITVSYLSRRIHSIASDSSLNPWRIPILRNLQLGEYEPSFNNLCVRYIVPRQNWVEILSLARADFLLFHATLPNLKAHEWEECFKRRFLPGWRKWKKDGSSWKEAFMKILYRVWHRSHTSCTTDEAWTKYVVLNRNGSVNELESSSRSFNPSAIFNEMKHQSNMSHLETRIRFVIEFADIRILAFGVLNRIGTMFLNTNAHDFLHPPGIESAVLSTQRGHDKASANYAGKDRHQSGTYMEPKEYRHVIPAYYRLTHPIPALSHTEYPFKTTGGGDKRWVEYGGLEEGGLQWVGGLMLTAQLVGPHTRESFIEGPTLQDMDLILGMGRNQYASFSWEDFRVIAPWMEEKVTKIIFGPGLGN